MLSGRPSSAKTIQGSATRRPASAPVARASAGAEESLVKKVTLKSPIPMSVVAPKPIRPSSAGSKIGASLSSGSPGPTKQRPLSATKRRLTGSQFIPTDTADWITELYKLEPITPPPPIPKPTSTTTQKSEDKIELGPQSRASSPATLSALQSVPQFPSAAPDLDPLQTAVLLPDPTPLPIDLFDDINPPRPPFPDTVTRLLPSPILAQLPTWPKQLLPFSVTPTGTSLFHDLDCPTWTYDWSPCHILSFDPITNRFLIHFPTIRVDKWVTRLNVCFDCESRTAFNARRSAAWHARAHWQAQVEMWHQVAAVRLRTPSMPKDVRQRIVDRLMAVGGEWKGITKRPARDDWTDKLNEHAWHWMFAMKQAAMVGPSRDDKNVVAFQSVNADKVLPGDGSVVAWEGAWAAVTRIRASLMDVLDQSFAAEFASQSQADCQLVMVVKPLQDWCKAMSAKCARIEHKLLVDWRASAAKAISQVPCLGPIYIKVPRLVDCLVHTLFQQAVDRMHSAVLDAARVDQEIGAPFTRPRVSVEAVIESSGESQHSLRLEPTAVQARQLMVQLIAEMHQALSERWIVFSLDPNLIATNNNSPNSTVPTHERRHALVAPDPTPALLYLARAYARGDALVSQLSTCLWLLDPGPESVCYTQPAPSANADCTWRTEMLSRIATVLTNLSHCRALLFDRASTAPTVGDILHFDVGTTVRRLRARWRAWDTCCRSQLAHVFATSCTQLELICESATRALHVSGVGTDPATWSVLADTLAHQQAQLDLAHAVAAQLAAWWEVCYAHGVDLADADSERYWSALAIPRQLVCEYAVANEELERARRDFVARVRVASAHIEASLGAHVIELADIGRERSAGRADKVTRRVAALRVRVEKLVGEREAVVGVQRAIGMRGDELEPGQNLHDMWPGVTELMGNVMRASRLWDTTVVIQDALATYRKTFFTQLPRDALGAQLVSWKDTLVNLLMEHASNAAEDVNARHVVDQVHEQCAAIANMWPILYALSSPHLQMRHWFQITKRIGLAAHDLEMLTLEQVLDQKLDLLTDILLTGSGAHRLTGWDMWEMPLTEVAVRERDKRGTRPTSVASSMLAMASLDALGHAPPAAAPLPPGQEALAITIRNNSIHLDAVASGPHLWPSVTRTLAGAHGPTAKLVNRHQVTIPFTRIVSIQIRPPDARRYLTRELEWLAWNGAKKLASLTVGGEHDERLDCVDEEEDGAESAFLTTPPSTLNRPAADSSSPTSPGTTKAGMKSHPAVPTISTTINGHSAVRRGIWCTRRGNVFYYVACSTEESVGDPVLEAQLMGQSAIALYLEPAEDEMPLAKVVVSVPRGVSPELFAERVQNACAREIILE